MPFDPNKVTDDDVLKKHTNGKSPVMGCDAPRGWYTGKKLDFAGRDYCNIARWIQDNTEYTASVVMEFNDVNSTISVNLYKKNNPNPVKVFGPRPLTGGAKKVSGFADRHELAGTISLWELAKKLEEQLIADGVVLVD